MKIAYFGYDFFVGCLEEVVASPHELILVGTDPRCDNKRYNFNERTIALAKKSGVPILMERVTSDVVRQLESDGCDLIITAAYPYRVPIEATSRLVGINVHPTLLPIGRGPWPLPYIIFREFSRSGTTLHKLDEKFDTGDIISQEAFGVSKVEYLESLSAKTRLAGSRLLRSFLADPKSMIEGAKSQQSRGPAEYWPMPTAADRTLDWTKSVAELHRIVRAFGKFTSWAKFDEFEWLVEDATVWTEKHNLAPGTVVQRGGREIVIAASDGFVCLRHFEVDQDAT